MRTVALYRMGVVSLTETPLDTDLPGQRLSGDPQGQRPSWTETPWTEMPLDGDPAGQRPLWNRHTGQRPPEQRPLVIPKKKDSLERDPSGQRCPWTETPRQRPPKDRDPPGQRPLCTETPREQKHLPATLFAGRN